VKIQPQQSQGRLVDALFIVGSHTER